MILNFKKNKFVHQKHFKMQSINNVINLIADNIKLLRELGFVIHSDKSVLTPSQTIAFLGFVISSKHMTLSLTDDKKNKIKPLLLICLHSQQVSIRELARILGNIAASFPAVTFGSLYQRHLESDKIRGLKYHKGIFEGKTILFAKAVSEIHWWINNINNSCHHIDGIPIPDINIHTDPSLVSRNGNYYYS